jgi:hypothetical protein
MGGMSMTQPEASADKPVVLLNVGSKKRKQIKQLRKGSGKLMQDVHETIAQLKADNEIEPSGQVVVVVVKEKRKRRGLLG